MDSIETTIGEVEDIIFDRMEEIRDDIAIYDIRMDDNEQIETDGIRVDIPDLGYSARFGEYLRYYEEEDVYEADFSLTLIYDINERDPQKYLYWEQDGLAISLYNYLRASEEKKDVNDISEMKCVIEIETEN